MVSNSTVIWCLSIFRISFVSWKTQFYESFASWRMMWWFFVEKNHVHAVIRGRVRWKLTIFYLRFWIWLGKLGKCGKSQWRIYWKMDEIFTRRQTARLKLRISLQIANFSSNHVRKSRYSQQPAAMPNMKKLRAKKRIEKKNLSREKKFPLKIAIAQDFPSRLSSEQFFASNLTTIGNFNFRRLEITS